MSGEQVKVMLSASKYIGGHSDMTGGALVTKDPVLAQRRWEVMSQGASGFSLLGPWPSHGSKKPWGLCSELWSSSGKARFLGQSRRRHRQPLRG